MRVEQLPTLVLSVLLAGLLGSVILRIARAWMVRRYGTARWRDTYRRLRLVRTNRFKLTQKARLRAELAQDPVIRQAILDHADETGASLGEGEERVQSYLEEIIPAFDLVTYYRLGLPIAALAVRAIYKLAAWKEAIPDPKALHKDNAVVYVFNHRSNADFIFASLELHDRVQLSYAVGEWARVWPLDGLFKAFGSYFVRRGFKEKLYHTVLRRYVQTITRHGVTQGIFLEGGLSRDGWFRPAKVGLLDAVLQVVNDADFDKDLLFVPGAMNYDRVLEDRSLTAEAAGKKPERSLLRMLRRTARILFRNSLKLALQRVRKHGYAALRLGEPISFRRWLAEHGRDIVDGDRDGRAPLVQAFGDHLLEAVKRLMPVCAVPLVCLGLERLGMSALGDDLEEEVEALRKVLEQGGARCVRGDKTPEEMTRYAIVLLETRGTLYRDEAGALRVRAGDEDLVRYYARSIAHLATAEQVGAIERAVM